MEYHRVHALACGKQVEVTAVVLDSRFTRYCVSMLPTEHRQLLMLLAFHVAGLFMVAIPNTARKQIAVKYNMHYMMYFFASLAAGAFTTSNIAYVGSQPCNGQAAAKNLAATGVRDMAALALRQRVSRHWGSHKQGQVVEAKALDHLLCVRVDLKRSHRWVKRRHLGHVLVLTLTLLLLELEREPRTGPRWIRLIRWVVKPAILLRRRFEGTMATSSITFLLVWKSTGLRRG